MLEATLLESHPCVCRDDPWLWKPSLVHRRLSDRNGRTAKAWGAELPQGVPAAFKNLITSRQPFKPGTSCSRINRDKPTIASHVAVAGMPWIGRESVCRALERLRILWNCSCLCSTSRRGTAGASCHVISASCHQF